MMTTQMKFIIDADVALAFRARCAEGGVSMASEIKRFMQNCRPAADTKAGTSTRPLRRKAVAGIIGSLNIIMAQEEAYRDNIPEVFTQRYDDADHACSQLSDAIACLEEAF